ncbi:MAG: glycosyltransferase [Solirubrobacterales bacterium]|nr:glycosyltransferase [Solirubrobacterales bacterium]
MSLLMPNRNNASVLEYVLERLATNTTYSNYELVAVDDGSTDGSIEILRRFRDGARFSEFKLIELSGRGVVEALNTGLGEATGELVVQLDADASIETAGWLERMLSFFLSDERIGVITAKIVFDWGEIHTCGVDVVGPEGFHDRGATITEPVGARRYHQRVLRSREDECRVCEQPAEVDGGIGCCMMYRRDAALGLGGYDPGYAPVWFDDLDLTLGFRRQGLKVFFTPEVRVVHHVGQRLRHEPPGRRAVIRSRRAIGTLLPRGTRRRITQSLNIDRPPPDQWERLLHHYGYFSEKWGWDVLNPDMAALIERWGHTELCWRFNPEMRQAGAEIIARFRHIAAL